MCQEIISCQVNPWFPEFAIQTSETNCPPIHLSKHKTGPIVLGRQKNLIQINKSQMTNKTTLNKVTSITELTWR